MDREIAGRGRKRSQYDVPAENLHLDPNNPRLPKDLKGKPQKELISTLTKYFDLDELAQSMAENGYFDEEPLVAVPRDLPTPFRGLDSVSLAGNQEYLAYLGLPTTHFTVIEGNRRLATVKILLSAELRREVRGASKWPSLSVEARSDLSVLPVIVYARRDEVRPYMGVRHVTGVKKWEAFSKAAYVAETVENNKTLDDVQRMVGDRSSSVRKLYLGYKLIEQAEDQLELDTSRAKEYFSYLILAIGQRSVKDFLGIPDRLATVNYSAPVEKEKLDNLQLLFSWLFGEGKEKLPVLKESRDITSYLSPVLRNEEATKHLTLTRDLVDAYERSDGEKQLLLRNLRRASKSLSSSLGIITRYKGEEDVKGEVAYCQEILGDITTLLQG